jgi:predicted small lipoprotein YifL
MKKIVTLFMVFMLMFGLAGCKKGIPDDLKGISESEYNAAVKCVEESEKYNNNEITYDEWKENTSRAFDIADGIDYGNNTDLLDLHVNLNSLEFDVMQDDSAQEIAGTTNSSAIQSDIDKCKKHLEMN